MNRDRPVKRDSVLGRVIADMVFFIVGASLMTMALAIFAVMTEYGRHGSIVAAIIEMLVMTAVVIGVVIWLSRRPTLNLDRLDPDGLIPDALWELMGVDMGPRTPEEFAAWREQERRRIQFEMTLRQRAEEDTEPLFTDKSA